MTNWYQNKDEVRKHYIDSAMKEIEWLTALKKQSYSANYWLDPRHNIFAFINNDGDDIYIELHYELYMSDYDDYIGDLEVVNTIDNTKESLLKEINSIVDMYLMNK